MGGRKIHDRMTFLPKSFGFRAIFTIFAFITPMTVNLNINK